MLVFYYRNAFLIMKLSNLPSFRAIWVLIAVYFLTFLLLFVSHHCTQALECFDMWYFGNRFVIDAIFMFKCEDEQKSHKIPLTIVHSHLFSTMEANHQHCLNFSNDSSNKWLLYESYDRVIMYKLTVQLRSKKCMRQLSVAVTIALLPARPYIVQMKCLEVLEVCELVQLWYCY